ncbi:MAG: flagellar basal body P-ring formation chaperone FlgA [Sulfurospirillum sp.]
MDGLKRVDASLFDKHIKQDFFILDLPKNRARYTVSSLKILSKFKKNDINITDLSNGTVIFKNCHLPIDVKLIKTELAKKFKERFPSIEIKSISISSPSSLGPGLSFYKIDGIELKPNSFERSKGVLGVRLIRDNETRKIYLKFDIDATITVFKANYNLRNGKILQKDDYIKKRVKLDRLRNGVITGKLQKNYIVKGYIKKDTILNARHFRIKKDILRGEYIKAVFRNGNLVLETDAHLLNDANIGDTVRIKTSSGKTLRAKIISLKTAKILE